jgi:acetyl-CoA C-acetyltransferase
MGHTAENVASLRGISREEQDAFALRSQRLASQAIAEGFFAREIVPVTVGDDIVLSDESVRSETTAEGLASLKPVFRPQGTITAGNCCPLSDGAAAVIVMSADKARGLQLSPVARIRSYGVSALSPEVMGLGPVESTRKALLQANMSIDDIDLVEMNEAFSAQVLPSCHDLGLNLDRVNVHGGAIALGHPFGMGGARLTTTLLNGLIARDVNVGLVTMCAAGGQGMSMIVERI